AQNPTTRWVGVGWLALGFCVYTVYRRRFVHVPLADTIKAAPLLGPAIAVERRATIVCLRVLVLGPEQPLDADLSVEEAEADRLLDEAHQIAETYGVRMVERVLRPRHAHRAIVEADD